MSNFTIVNNNETSCEKIIVRFLLRPSHFNANTKTVTFDAFIPRENGKDDDGISIEILIDKDPFSDQSNYQLDQTIKKYFKNNKNIRFCSLHTGRVRDFKNEYFSNLNVHPQVKENPNHGIITGIPKPNFGSLTSEIERKTTYLASIARYFELT